MHVYSVGGVGSWLQYLWIQYNMMTPCGENADILVVPSSKKHTWFYIGIAIYRYIGKEHWPQDRALGISCTRRGGGKGRIRVRAHTGGASKIGFSYFFVLRRQVGSCFLCCFSVKQESTISQDVNSTGIVKIFFFFFSVDFHGACVMMS